MIRRAQHWTDTPIEGRKRRRQIRNWANYRTPHHGFVAAAPLITEATRKPDDWDGEFDFQRTSQAGALQTFFGDTRDLANPAMVGLRLADRPGFWVNFRAMGTLPNPDTIAEGARHAWRGLWKNTTLRYIDSAHKLTKEIVLREPGHPTRFRFSVKLPPHLTLIFRNGGGAILGPNGTERLTLLAPWGEDADGKAIRATMRQGLDTSRGLPTVVIEVNEDDLAGAVYPVTIDPTATITGTTDIEDNWLQQNVSNRNRGADTTLDLNNSTAGNRRRGVIRISAGSIPAGSISGFRMLTDVTLVLLDAQASQVVEVYFIADANDWVEGTVDSSVQIGSSCYGQKKLAEEDWAGGLISGCGVSGTDYDADGSPPTMSVSVTGPQTFTLDLSWPPLWRDAARVANGMVFDLIEVGSNGGLVRIKSSEHADPLSFEVDYTAPSGSAIAAMSMPRSIQ